LNPTFDCSGIGCIHYGCHCALMCDSSDNGGGFYGLDLDRVAKVTWRLFWIWRKPIRTILGSSWRLSFDMQISFAERIGVCDFPVGHVDCKLLGDVGIGSIVGKDKFDVLFPISYGSDGFCNIPSHLFHWKSF
jgi:hypothetical protein